MTAICSDNDAPPPGHEQLPRVHHAICYCRQLTRHRARHPRGPAARRVQYRRLRGPFTSGSRGGSRADSQAGAAIAAMVARWLTVSGRADACLGFFVTFSPHIITRRYRG